MSENSVCQIEGCDEPVAGDADFCTRHLCRTEGCFKPICYVYDCDEQSEYEDDGDEQSGYEETLCCSDHTNRLYHSELLRKREQVKLIAQCQIEGCDKPVVGDLEFCEVHTCCVEGCLNAIDLTVSDSGYLGVSAKCAAHLTVDEIWGLRADYPQTFVGKCRYRGCQDPATSHSLFCVSHRATPEQVEQTDCEETENPISPSHYKVRGYEVIDIIDAFELNFNLGNVLKYLLRAGRKDPAKTHEDLAKARYYLTREIDNRSYKK